jgi:hypothetical protein
MKMRLLIIGMSVVMSSPIVAMHRRAAPVSYRTPAIVGGAVLAAYGVVWFNDYWKSVNTLIWDLEAKLADASKIYNWRLEQYPVDSQIQKSVKSSPYDHTTSTEGRKDVIDFDNLFARLMADHRKLNLADNSPEAFYKRIHEEKEELLKNIDDLAKLSSYFFNWYNIRKTYKHLCITHIPLSSKDIKKDNKDVAKKKINLGSSEPTDQTQWPHVFYTEKMEKPIDAATQTNLWHLVVGKPMYGRTARLFWQYLTRYYRLEKIELELKGAKDEHHRLIINPEVVKASEDAWTKIKDARDERAKKEDQVLSSWLYEKLVEPVRGWCSGNPAA